MKKTLAILLLLTFFSLLVSHSTVFAQEDEGSIRQQLTTTNDQEKLRQEYRQVIETYRTQEGQYNVSKLQYEQLQTLTALEKAVKDTRLVMLTRDDLLLRYLQLLRLQLSDTHGAPLDQKAQVINNLLTQEAALKSHLAQVEATTRRTELAKNVEAFIPLGKDVEIVAYQAQELMAFGKVQNVFDKTVALTPIVNDKLPERNTGALLEEKKRGMEEIQRNLDALKLELVDIRDDVIAELPTATTNSHKNLLTKLETPYVNLVKALSYFEEVMR